MAATEVRNRPAAAEQTEEIGLSVKLAEQVSEILKEAAEWKKIPQPAMVYRVPSPGVRYYF